MTDLISRQAAINAINALHEKPNAWLDSAVDAVMTLPSAEPQWIPVSERLPEKDGWYLCAVGSSYMPIRTMCYAPNEWRKDDQNTWKDTYGYYVFNWFVVAWMPLPEPYEGDKE